MVAVASQKMFKLNFEESQISIQENPKGSVGSQVYPQNLCWPPEPENCLDIEYFKRLTSVKVAEL